MTPASALAAGWSIIPTGKNKKPLLASWKEFQSRRPTEKELSAWLALQPPTWAVITGAISGRITLDFDGVEGRQTLSALGLAPHRSTPSGGFHVDFAHPGWHVPTLNAKSKRGLGARWPGLDIRGDGGYAVFTGKTHRGEYRWLRDPTPYPVDILPLDLREFLGLLRAAPTSAPTKLLIQAGPHDSLANGRVQTERLIQMALDQAPRIGRNNAGFWLAVQLRDNGYSLAEAETAMADYCRCCPCTNVKGERESYTEQEVRASLREVFSRPAREPWMFRQEPGSHHRPETAPSEPEPNLLCQPHTDTGNAERLVACYGNDIHFCAEMKKWLVWDGRRWTPGDNRGIKVLAKKTVRRLYLQAAAADKGFVEAVEKHARKSESAQAINAMLSCAEYENGILVSASELDQHPYLLNVRNGTLDLQSGQLREHRREDLITKLIHFDYDVRAQCPLFMRFLYTIMGDGPDASDPERERATRLVRYLQKCFGYALTADVSEKAVFCFFGSGR